MLDLKDDEQLRTGCISLQEQVMSLAGNQSWIAEFQKWLVRVRDVSHEETLWGSTTPRAQTDISAAVNNLEERSHVGECAHGQAVGFRIRAQGTERADRAGTVASC